MRATLQLGLAVLFLGLLLVWLLASETPPPGEVPRAELSSTAAMGEAGSLAASDALPASLVPDVPMAGGTVDTRQAVAQISQGAHEVAAAEGLARFLAQGRQGFWVHVVDGQGQPLEGVQVVLRDSATLDWPPKSEGTSDADGRLWFASQFLSETANLRVEPAGPGGSDEGVAVRLSELGDDPVLLVLGIGAGVDVHVVDERGADTEGALVRIVTSADFDARYGRLHVMDGTRVAKGQVLGGVCSFERLPADTDFTVAVQAPPPLGSIVVRARTPARGLRARVEARFSASDVLLLGSFVGHFAESDWGWTIFAPGRPGQHSWAGQNRLDVGEDGSFVVRLPPALWGQFGSGACLAVNYGQVLLEVVELAPLSAPGVVQLEPMSVFSPILGSGHVTLLAEGEPQKIRLGLAGNRRGVEPVLVGVLGKAQPDARGAFSFRGRVPAGWTWQFQSLSEDWEVVEPSGFRPGQTDHKVELRRVGGPNTARLVPGLELSRTSSWAEHLFVEVQLRRVPRRDRWVPSSALCTPSRDGRFEVGHPIENVQSVRVMGTWHNRPLLERDVIHGDTLELQLPAGLRLVRLDVRGDDGGPLPAKPMDPGLGANSRFQQAPSTPMFVLLDGQPQDVLVRARGYQDTLVKAVERDQRVDLVERGASLRLRALDMPDLPPGVTLRPVLARGTRGEADYDNAPAFDNRGEATLHAPGLGEFYVHLQLERMGPSGMGVRLLQGADSPRIVVSEPKPGQAPAEFTLAFDWAPFLRAMEGKY